MEERIPPEEVVTLVESVCSNIEYKGHGGAGKRHEYQYEGLVHAHKVPVGYEIVGFGEDWFALREV